jgi:dihydroorotate dehydrogenase
MGRKTRRSDKLKFLKAVKKAVSIPVAVKLGPFYSNPLYVDGDG